MTAENKTSQTPELISVNPGRTTIRPPATARKIPSQRIGPTCSPRKTIARIATKTGPIRLTAVASPTGMRVSAVNQDSMDTVFRKERPICQDSFCVRRTPTPERMKKGMKTRRPNATRKKTTSKE